MPSWGTILRIAESVLLPVGQHTAKTPSIKPRSNFERPSSRISLESLSPKPHARTTLHPRGQDFYLDRGPAKSIDSTSLDVSSDSEGGSTDSIKNYSYPDGDDEFRIEWNKRCLVFHNKVSNLEIEGLQSSVEISKHQSSLKNEESDVPLQQIQYYGLGLPELHIVATMAETVWVRPWNFFEEVSDAIMSQLREIRVGELAFKRWLGSQIGDNFRQRMEASAKMDRHSTVEGKRRVKRKRRRH